VAFEWDTKKNALNVRKHGIDFVDACTIFDGPCLERVDDLLDYGEDRMVAFGELGPYVVAVVYVARGIHRRLISARLATQQERKAFYEAIYGKE